MHCAEVMDLDLVQLERGGTLMCGSLSGPMSRDIAILWLRY